MDMRKIFMLAVVILLLAGCSKEGPAGPAGSAGPAGQAGAGNVHVESFTVLNSEWEQLSNGMQVTRQVPSLTQEVVVNDAVLMYMLKSGHWYLLPCQINALHYTFTYQTGQVTIIVTGTQIPTTLLFKLMYVMDSE